MKLTRDFEQTIVERIHGDPLYSQALFDKALTLTFMREPETARVILRNLVHGTLGFEILAERTGKSATSLRRMFSARGNPSMNSLATIVESLGDWLHLSVEVRSARAAPASPASSNGSPKRRLPTPTRPSR